MRSVALPDEIQVRTEGASTDEDRYGNPIPGPPAIVTFAAFVQPMDATEDEIGRDVRISRYEVWTAPDAPITGTASIVWEGHSLEVIGEPLRDSRQGLRLLKFTAREITE